MHAPHGDSAWLKRKCYCVLESEKGRFLSAQMRRNAINLPSQRKLEKNSVMLSRKTRDHNPGEKWRVEWVGRFDGRCRRTRQECSSNNHRKMQSKLSFLSFVMYISKIWPWSMILFYLEPTTHWNQHDFIGDDFTINALKLNIYRFSQCKEQFSTKTFFRKQWLQFDKTNWRGDFIVKLFFFVIVVCTNYYFFLYHY